MKCSFCEQTLVCKTCRHPFQPRRREMHLAAFQPDMQIFCPECRKPLVCRWCGCVYGDASEGEEEQETGIR